MKKTLKTGKKALSVFMAALMILTAWVFFAPEKAEAASQGKYYVVINYKITDTTYKNDHNYVGKNNFKENKDDNNVSGISLFYKADNGTGKEYEVYWDIGRDCGAGQASGSGASLNNATRNVNSKGDGTCSGTIPGFPTWLYVVNDNHTGGAGVYEIYSITVNGTQIWGGTIHMDSSYKQKYGTLKSDYTWSSNDKKNAKCDTTYRNWSFPYINSVSWNEKDANVTVPKDNKTATVSTSSATVYDQYGAEWYQEPYYALNTTNAAKTSNDVRINGVTLSTYGMADTTTLQVTNAAKDWVYEGGNFKKDVYINAYISGKVTGVKKVTISNCQYTATFDDSLYGGQKTSSSVYYYKYTKVSAPGHTNPAATPDVHYVFKGWKNTKTGAFLEDGVTTLTEDTTFVSVYDAIEHDWEETKRVNPTCKDFGRLDEKCSVCGRERSTQLAIVDHDYSVKGDTIPPTCDEQGYTLYKCKYGCGKDEKRDYVSANGHDWELVNTVEPKCEVDGSKTYKCKVCGKQKEDKIEKTGHSYVESKSKEPTCEEPGWATYQCSKCKSYDPNRGGAGGTTVSALGHDWDYKLEEKWAVDVAPTCTEKGREVRTCKRDPSHKEYRDLAPTGHDFDESNTIVVAPTCTQQGYSYYPCKHTNCTEQKKFNFVPANGHDEKNATWKVTVKATCETNGWRDLICPVCKEVIRGEEIEMLGHKWGEYVKSKEATCTDNAKQTAPCLNEGCKKTDTIDIPNTAKGHLFENYVPQNDATCVKDGTKKAQCEHYNYNEKGELVRCTATDIQTDEGTVLGHDFSIYFGIKSAATCTENRVDIYKCSRCDETEDREAPGTALDHNVKTWIHDEGSETCCEYGTKHGTCTRDNCGYVVTGVEDTDYGYAPHVYEKDKNGEIVYHIDEATLSCLKNATEVAKCQNAELHKDDGDGKNWNCGNKLERESKNSRLPHTYPDPVTERDLFHSNNDGTCLANGTMYAYCKTCGIAKITVEEPDSTRGHFVANWISDGNATCTEDGTKHGTCAYGCGTEFTNEPDVGSKLGHWFRDYVYNNDATCTEDGTRTATCEREGCDETKSIAAVGTALGHDWSNWALVDEDATCTEGAEVERHCERDGCTASETKTIEAKGHDWKWVILDEIAEDGTVIEADCTRGYNKIKECNICHIQDETSKTYVSGGAHHMVRTVTDATCVKDGLTVVYCDVCNNESVRTETAIPATGHLNSELDESTVKKATCKDKGYTGDEVCVVCGTVTKYGEEIDVTSEHVFSAYVKITDATCTENATEKAICSVCGKAESTREIPGSALGHYFKNYVSDGNATCTGVETQTAKCERCDAVDTIKKYGTALGHDWSDWATIEAATCTHAGKAEKHCKREGCTVSVTKNLRKLSHVESEWIIDEEASCTKTGKRHKECLNGCGYVFKEEVIPMKEHDFVVSECTATCIDDGFSTYVCSVCGTEKKGDVVPALGHDWSGEWVITTEPTCTKKGVETLKCTRCDKTKTRAVDALGHNVVVDPAVPATCTKDGLSEGSHCDRCGKVLVEQEKVVKPHYDGDGDGKCDECGKELNHSTDLNCNCICHKQFWLMRVIYKILRFFWKLFKIGHSCACGAVHY